MTEQDYELLSRYLDAELPAADAATLELRLAAEPSLQENLDKLRDLNSVLKNTFNQPGIEQVPARIQALLAQDPAPRITPLPHRRTRGIGNWGFAAMAASLVVAVSAVLVAQWSQDGSKSGKPHVDAMLSQVLEHSASGTHWESLPDGRQARAVLSFQDKNGNWCREYLLSTANTGWHGVACRSGEAWTNNALAAAAVTPRSSDAYRPAGAMASDQVADFINSNAAGIALSARQEAEIIAREWR